MEARGLTVNSLAGFSVLGFGARQALSSCKILKMGTVDLYMRATLQNTCGGGFCGNLALDYILLGFELSNIRSRFIW